MNMAYRHSSFDELDNVKHMLPLCDRYTSFSSTDGCAPFAISLPMLDTSPMASETQRRASFDHLESSMPPELLSGSSVGTTSPSTPLNSSSFDATCMESLQNTVPDANLQVMLALQEEDFAEHDFGFSPEAAKDQGSHRFFNPYSLVHTTSDVHTSSATFYSASYDGLPDALSRPMFNDTISSLTPMAMNTNNQWLFATIAQTPPRTIDPSTFAHLTSNSTIVKAEHSTPSRSYPRSSVILSSSPMSGYSPRVVPSQHHVDDSAYFDPSILAQESTDLVYESIERERRLESRLHRRRYHHKDTGSSGKRRSLTNKSGIDCEAVIPQNSFACSYPDCIDKNTGKQKKFKRQEHKKRHEKTVHEKEAHISHTCWVPQCERAFSRTDNLKSHLKNTHGKRSANARNRYVATLDPGNPDYYSPDWVGDLTSEGLPIER